MSTAAFFLEILWPYNSLNSTSKMMRAYFLEVFWSQPKKVQAHRIQDFAEGWDW